jgi:hypothetical protein
MPIGVPKEASETFAVRNSDRHGVNSGAGSWRRLKHSTESGKPLVAPGDPQIEQAGWTGEQTGRLQSRPVLQSVPAVTEGAGRVLRQEHREAQTYLSTTRANQPWPHKSRPGFVNYVQRRFRSPAEMIEPGRGHNLPNALLAGLGT